MEKSATIKEKKGRSRNLVLHLHPPRVSKESIRFTLTFGLGGMAAVLFLLQVFTGVLLRFVYVASPAEAYDSILTLQDSILFGKLIRNLHHWSGIFFVLVTFLHLLRTFYTGSFYWERRWNWVIGIVLMVLVIFSNFTGYLLPWDQLAFWAITVSTSMLNYIPLFGTQLANFVRGGNEVGAPTLLIFYNFHTAILPLTLVILMTFHFWRVRKNKGVQRGLRADGGTVTQHKSGNIPAAFGAYGKTACDTVTTALGRFAGRHGIAGCSTGQYGNSIRPITQTGSTQPATKCFP